MVVYLEKSEDNRDFHQKVDFLSSCSITYALTQIHAIVDGKAVVISESSVRSDLLFNDEDGITCLTNDEIFENLALMGYEPLSTKLTFKKGRDIGGSLRRQDTMGGTSAQTRSERVLEQPSEPPLPEGHTSGSGEGRMEHPFALTNFVPPTPYDSSLSGGCTPGSNEGRLKLEELMVLYTTLGNRVTTLENELSTTKFVYHKAFITLTKRVKKLETQLKQKRSKTVIHSLDEEEPSVDIEDSPKQGRMIEELDKNEDVNLEATRQDQERYNLEKALELQRQLDQRKEDVAKGDQAKKIDWNDPTDQVHTFVPKDFEIEKEVMKRAGFDLQHGSSKKQRLDQQTKQIEEIEEEVKAQGDSDQGIEEMKLYMRIIPDEDLAIDAIPLATKP
nr:hypothetical protein [Tanacetum cinerariifolium]